ncbi:phosphotransferase [Empedobacter sp. 225-1]|uniref:aminoglycoside phosphotransferase family protein n=1 Tax=unclassified Empedobacter TaxID=2643773 RepID=UPI002578B990|nr:MULTISPECIES: phosphotransferase [unclassified Empedobacter]MDM1523726.1 phosphotransferase [Empedobacter sp. 225-1]MDM1543670.1 phosphotransferase [Empedobacter sp. 189-2]
MNDNTAQFLHENFTQKAIDSLTQLSGGASSRKYSRFFDQNQSYILAESSNTEENKVFIQFSIELKKVIDNVPEIISVSEDFKTYVQTDLGDETLMNLVLNDLEKAKPYYFKTLEQLAIAQIQGKNQIDFNHTFSYPRLDKTLILRDLFQFNFYFLDVLGIDYNAGKLIKDFDRFASQFDQISPQGFVFRDFQTRNIMIHHNEPYFIDYQGGLYGPIVYDLVSLIWQAKANLPFNFKKELYEFYYEQLKKQIPTLVPIDFRQSYEYCVVARLLQVLGAYGLRGLIERKKHFIESISFGLKNLESIIDYPILQNYPELKNIIKILVLPTTLERVNHKING